MAGEKGLRQTGKLAAVSLKNLDPGLHGDGLRERGTDRVGDGVPRRERRDLPGDPARDQLVGQLLLLRVIIGRQKA